MQAQNPKSANQRNSQQIQKIRDDAAEFWEARKHRKYKGAGMPSIIFDFRPPFLFDCRINSTRRMGVGDQLCLVAAIQAVADYVGHDNVRVWYDPAYPGSEAVWGMSGLLISARGTEYPSGHTVIPCRGHIMERGDEPCLYGEQQGSPIGQVFYNWGWHGLFRANPIRLRLTPGVRAVIRAREIMQGAGCSPGGYVTATPLEVSRHNNNCNAEAWRSALSGIPDDIPVLFGCAPNERNQLRDMIDAMALSGRAIIISEPLPVWKALIDGGQANYTGNSCGMWLSFASRTPTYLLQFADPAHQHNHMWDYKPAWGCGNIRLTEIKA
jgi:hypothetical protein